MEDFKLHQKTFISKPMLWWLLAGVLDLTHLPQSYFYKKEKWILELCVYLSLGLQKNGLLNVLFGLLREVGII